jgi:hypothetical protein
VSLRIQAIEYNEVFILVVPNTAVVLTQLKGQVQKQGAYSSSPNSVLQHFIHWKKSPNELVEDRVAMCSVAAKMEPCCV